MDDDDDFQWERMINHLFLLLNFGFWDDHDIPGLVNSHNELETHHAMNG